MSTLAGLTANTLETALLMTDADYGNVQLVDPGSSRLTIVAQTGFDADFLDYFSCVEDDNAACGRALQNQAQVVIPDVNRDPGFLPHREIAAAAGFRAVQSTPLTGAAGNTVGVVSTHFRRPKRIPRRDVQSMAFYGRLAGAALAPHLLKPGLSESDPATESRTTSELTRLRPEVEQVQHALGSRVAIEQAKGFMAASNGISVDQAFEALRRYARNHNAPIHAVADAVANRQLRL